MAKPTLIAVTGPPGSGKTTLAHALAPLIPCPAICRDEIKEGMTHAYGPGFDGDELSRQTFPLFFEVVRALLEGEVTVVAEAAFQDRLWRPNLEPLLELAELRVVRCEPDPAVRAQRVTTRTRRAHDHQPAAGALEFGWITIAAPTISVDTTDGYAPALADVAAFVSSPA